MKNPKFRNLTNEGLLAHFAYAERAHYNGRWTASEVAEIAFECAVRGIPIEF